MKYLVRMDVNIPADLPADHKAEVVAREKEYSQQLQREGKWVHLWRVVGEYANFSVFEVEGNEELHAILSGLPLYPYMTIQVTPLTAHPSAVSGG